MKEAIRYAELLETGCFITHQEQEDIAKLLRRLAMIDDPEEEAFQELEAKLNKQKKEKPVTDREALQIAYNALVEIDRQTPYPIAKHAIHTINKAFNAHQDYSLDAILKRVNRHKRPEITDD